MPPVTLTDASAFTKRYDLPLTSNALGVRSAPSVSDDDTWRRPPRSVRSRSPVYVVVSPVVLDENVSRPTGRSMSETMIVSAAGEGAWVDTQRPPSNSSAEVRQIIGGEGSSTTRAASNHQFPACSPRAS